jgi:hypothetical protein
MATRKNPDGSVTVGILPEEKKEEKPSQEKKPPRKRAAK